MDGRKHFAARLAICLAILTIPCDAWAKVIYVDDDAPAPGDGSSWQTAYKYLQDALTDASASEKPVEIRVARGIYRPDQGAEVGLHDSKASFRLVNGAVVRGGYAGLNGPDSDAWDPALYETVLWGDLEDDDDLGDETTFYDNSEHIVTASGTEATAVLEGVTITRGAYIAGFVRGGSAEPEGGVGLHNRSGSPTIRRCVFTQNLVVRARGAAMLNYAGAAPRLEECTFMQNYGRAALCNQESSPTLSNCRFLENEGVAIRETASSSQLDSCSFTDNWGSALTQESKSRTVLSNCTFTGNYGAIQGEDISCTDCIFVRNRTNYSAGAVLTSRGEFVRCVFRDNSTGNTGGAVWAATVTLKDCQLIHNAAPSSGALACDEADIQGCLFAGNQSDWMSPIWISRRCTLSNCTVIGNRSARQPTIDIRFADAVLTNCIVWGNPCQDTRHGEIFYGGGTTISYSCLKPLQHPVPGVGRFDADPCFASPGYWDPNGTPDDPNDDFFVEGDYHLKSQAGRWDPAAGSWVVDDVTSPCIDAGDPNTPVGYEPLPDGGRINMGAYGGTLEASKSTVQKLPVSPAKLKQALRDSQVGSTGEAPAIASEFGWVNFIRAGSGCYFQVPGVDPNDAAAVALRFVETWQDLFMPPNGAVGFEVIRVHSGASVKTVDLQQTYAGVKMSGSIVVDVKPGRGVTGVLVNVMTDTAALDRRPDMVRPSFGATTAQRLGEMYMERWHAGAAYAASAPELLILPPSLLAYSTDPCLVWWTEVRPVNGPCGERLFLDAHSGEVILKSPLCIR